MGLSENVVYPEKPKGFADHYPVFKWLFHWEYTPFSDIPICIIARLLVRANGGFSCAEFVPPIFGDTPQHQSFKLFIVARPLKGEHNLGALQVEP